MGYEVEGRPSPLLGVYPLQGGSTTKDVPHHISYMNLSVTFLLTYLDIDSLVPPFVP